MDEDIRKKILALLDPHHVMTIATWRPDGWPQATTVGDVNEDLTDWFAERGLVQLQNRGNWKERE
jgi:hypothetical protein